MLKHFSLKESFPVNFTEISFCSMFFGNIFYVRFLSKTIIFNFFILKIGKGKLNYNNNFYYYYVSYIEHLHIPKSSNFINYHHLKFISINFPMPCGSGRSALVAATAMATAMTMVTPVLQPVSSWQQPKTTEHHLLPEKRTNLLNVFNSASFNPKISCCI